MSSRLFSLFICFLPFTVSAKADCASDVTAAVAAISSNGPYRLDMQSQMGEDNFESSVDVIAEDRFRLGPYVRTPDGYFASSTKLDDYQGQVMTSDVLPFVTLGKSGIADAACPGVTSFEGADYSTVTFTTDASLAGLMSKAQVSLLMAADGKPAWILMDTNFPGVGEKKVKAKYTFDSAIAIDDPAK